jgi:cell division protease FtsH
MNKKNNGMMKNVLYYALVILAMVMVVYFIFGNNSQQTPDIEYSKFAEQLEDGKIKEFTVQPANGVYKITGEYKEEQKVNNSGGLSILGSTNVPATSFTTMVLPNDSTLSQVTQLAKENGVQTKIKEESSSGIWVSLLLSFLPIIVIIFFFYMMMGQQGGGGGGGGRVMNFGKSKAKEADKKANRIRFSDVAGAEEEKQELVEVVEFSKGSASRFAELGARIPAGCSIRGPSRNRVKLYLQKQSLVKQAFRFTQSQVLTSWKCLSGSAQAVSAICLKQPRKMHQRLSLLMKLTQWDVNVAPAWAADTMNVNKP